MKLNENRISQKRKNPPIDLQKWSDTIKQWNKADESQKIFCKRLGIKRHAFVYARNKLNKNKQASCSGFIPVRVKPMSTLTIENQYFTLENATGIKLHVPLSIDKDQLIYLLEQVGWNHA